MSKILLLLLVLVSVFFGQPEGYQTQGYWCGSEFENPFSTGFEEKLWKDFKKDNPDADGLVNSQITSVTWEGATARINCGDVAKKKFK